MVKDEEVKKFESEYKKAIYDAIGRINSSEMITSIESLGKHVDCKLDLSNYSIRLNNKIVELSHEFEKAGLSIFSEKIEDYGTYKLNYVISSVTGDAIIHDLLDKAADSSIDLQKISDKLSEMCDKKNTRINQLANQSKFSQFLLKIRSYFVKPKSETFNITEDDKKELYELVDIYDKKVDGITAYDIKDNIVDAVVKEVCESDKSKENCLGIIDENVAPALEKLGLGDSTSQIKEEVEKYYKEIDENVQNNNDFRNNLKTDLSYEEQKKQCEVIQKIIEENQKQNNEIDERE